MAFNPFLNMGEPTESTPTSTEVLNPFMMAVEEDMEAEVLAGENPFAMSNPFADWGGAAESVAADPEPPLDIFGGSNLFSPPEHIAKPTELELVHTVEETVPRRPPPPPRPLPLETQTLIQSVTGQMEFTSSHLLDRIPPTRTPSPVSVRDMQSPSPTPEPEHEPEPEPEPEPVPLVKPPVENLDINRNKPVRPPPARPAPPPPRPAPPPPPPKQHKQHDDINLFDAPPTAVHVKPTKEDILSLYSKSNKEEKPVDFLSDDLPNALDSDSNKSVTSGPFDSFSNTTKVSKQNTTVAATNRQSHEDDVPMENADMETSLANSPFNNLSEMDMQPEKESYSNPFEISGNFSSGINDQNIFSNQGMDSFAPQHNIFETSQPNIIESRKSSSSFDTVQAKESMAEVASPAGDAAWPLEPEASTTWPVEPEAAAWPAPTPTLAAEPVARNDDEFDAFSAKFDSTAANHTAQGAWGEGAVVEESAAGFEAEAFDPFLSMSAPPPPAATPRLDRDGSHDSADDNFTLVIRPKDSNVEGKVQAVPALAPPPRPQALPESPRANPFDREAETDAGFGELQPTQQPASADHGEEDSGPPTPLFDDDVSMPLEDFPRTKYIGPGWEMHLRQPNKKKITGQRFWKKVWVRLAMAGDAPVLQLLKTATDKEPFQELPLQACYSVSDIAAQQFDQFGKIFTVKLQYVFYKERPGVRPGQVTKAERITNKLSQFAAYAIQGDYQGVKEFGSDLRKLGLPVEHAPQVSQLFKLGSLTYEDVKQFSCCIEEALFRLSAHRDRALTYKLEEVQITAVDELYVEQDAEGSILKQIARVRLFFLGFLSGMPDVELGVNDLRRQGREVVGRHDIIPVVTEEWIRVEDTEFHACVQPEDFHKTQIIKFKPPDACYIELMRFRVRPPKNRELPLQLKAVWCVNGTRVELRADVLVPGFASRKLGQIPCEDVCIRFPIPECWIYLFRVEKHFRYGSVKSAHRRTGKIKGIERFLGAVDTLQESLIEVTSGQAKYEHQHRAIVWRMPRLPKEGQGAYTTHNMVCRMALTSFDQVPAELAPFATVEFTMPATQVSHTTVRSVSLQEHDGDPPEKYVRYLARHEYIVGIERTSGQEAPAYAAAARVVTAPVPAASPTPALAPIPAAPSSDSDSD